MCVSPLPLVLTCLSGAVHVIPCKGCITVRYGGKDDCFCFGGREFGTCLSCYLGKLGHKVLIWDRSAVTLRSIAESGFNSRYLPTFKLPDTVSPTADLQDVERADILLLTVPSHALREMLGYLRPLLPKQVKIVSTLKGLELETGLFPRQIAGDVLGENYLKT